MNEDSFTLYEYLRFKERDAERITPDNGLEFYVNNGFLKAVDGAGTREIPLDESTTIGGDVALSGGTTAAASGTLGGSWTSESASNDVQLHLQATAESDGTSAGTVDIAVDESGGTTADYTFTIATADPDEGAGASETDKVTVHLPAGAQYQIQNTSDPNAVNSLDVARKLTM